MLAVFGGITVFCLWLALDTLIWTPFALQLHHLGYRTFDKNTIALLMVGPGIVAILLLAGGILENFLAARAAEHSSLRAFFVMAVLPTLVVFIPGFPDSWWEYPLSGVSVFVVSVAVWGIYDRIERRAGG